MVTPDTKPFINESTLKLLPAGLLAGAFYAALRLAYVQFYSKLGLLPEDVGIGRTEILSQAVVGPVIIGLAYSGILAVLLSATLQLIGQLNVSTFLRWGGTALTAAFLLTFVLIYWRADQVGASVVEHGKSVRTVFLDLRLLRLPLLDTRALPVTVEWKEPENTPQALKSGTECMFYLGETDGVAVIYDVRTKQSIRFRSADAVVLTSREPDQLPPSCISG